MSRHVIAVYPGTFDPITLGHEDIVRRARELFDEVIIAVAIAHHKKTLFTLDERLAMVTESARQWPGVRVEPFDGLVFAVRMLPTGRFANVVKLNGDTPLGFAQFEADGDGKLTQLSFSIEEQTVVLRKE